MGAVVLAAPTLYKMKTGNIKMNNKQNHQTTHIKYGALEADIDIEIAPLILELWKGDIYTIASCQSNADNAIWIKFENPNAAALFLATALCAGTLTAEVFNDDLPESWHYCCHPYYITMDDDEFPGKIYDIIEFATCVYFPKSHLKKVLNQIRLSNLKENRV